MLISCRYYLILVWSIVPISKALGTTLPLYSNFTLQLRPLTHTHIFQWVCNCLYMWIIASERAKRLRETSIKNINRAQLEIRVGAKFPRHNQLEREREREWEPTVEAGTTTTTTRALCVGRARGRSNNPRYVLRERAIERALVRHNAREGESESEWEREQKPMAMLGLSRISGRPARWVRFRQLLAAVVPVSVSVSVSPEHIFPSVFCAVCDTKSPKKPPTPPITWNLRIMFS